MKWNEVKIFISSTFNDMHAERDYLITEVFPELNEWCEKRKIRLSDIDLRWGVTKEDSESGNTIKACLDCIDECRPFFLCFLGQRRGWVPDLNSGIDESTFEKYGWVKEKLGSYSITEMEIEHAALAPMYYMTDKYSEEEKKRYALFFFRNDPFKGNLFHKNILTDDQKRIYTNASADDERYQDQKLQEFKDRIAENQQVYHYDCRWDKNIITDELEDQGDVSKGRLTDFKCSGTVLKDIIIEELKKRISEEFPENVETEANDRYDEDAAEQEFYAQTSSFDFVGREEELSLLSEFVDRKQKDKAFFIYAQEGTGKSALLSRFVQDLRDKGRKVLYRSCAITEKSSNENDLYLSLGNEAGLFRGSEEEGRRVYRSLHTQFLNALMKNGYDTLILDGIDRLFDLRENKTIRERNIPEGFTLIISSDEKGSADMFGYPYEAYELKGFIENDQKHALIDRYLLRTLKKLDQQQKEIIISSKGSDLPLYLRVVLNELKNYGSFSMLEDKISAFGGTLISAFDEALEGIENEYDDDQELFKEMIVMIAMTRDGLNEDELLKGLEIRGFKEKDIISRIRILRRRIKPYLNHSGGRDNIHIRNMIKVIEERYPDMIDDSRRAICEIYLDNFRRHGKQIRNEWEEVHGAKEFLYQLAMLKDFENIEKYINDDSVFEHIYPCEYYSEYIHGSFFSADIDMDIWDPEKEDTKNNYRKMAEIFAKKARKNVATIYEKYDQPLYRTCERLRKQEDQSDFLEYRDYFYETTQLIKAAAAFERKGIINPKNIHELGESRNEYKRFINTSDFSQTESFMHYLSTNGSDETDLSHQIEDLADEVTIIERKIEKYLDSITF